MTAKTFQSGNPIATLFKRANEQPGDIAFWFAGRGWSYGQFASESLALARGLKRLGLKKGDIVAVHMTNRPEMLLVYAACMYLGLIAAPLRTAFKSAELLPLLTRLQPALYIGEAELYPNVVNADPLLLPFEKRYLVDNAPDGRIGHWSELLDRRDNRDLPIVVDADAPVVLICTSGTTGTPKLVCHTQATASAIVTAFANFRRTDDSDVTIVHQALAHASGFFFFLTSLHASMPFVLMTFDADAMLDVIARYRCTYIFGFPSQYAAMLARQQAQPRDLYTLRLCLTASDVCPRDVQEAVVSAFGCELFNVWGSTETFGLLTFGVRPGPVSRIADGAEVRLIDRNGNDVPHGEMGELCVRGPCMFAGYWQQPDATAEAIRDGWFHTGDLMQRGENDEVWFVGRLKDIIIRGGTNISPIEIEEALVAAHPAVRKAAAVGIPDTELGQRVVGFIVLAEGGPRGMMDDIRAAVSDRLADYKVPEWLAVLPDLPLNYLGKLDRKALAAMAQWRDEEDRQRPSMWRNSLQPVIQS
jgi:long-chain acyl-CoA synthetase